MADGLSNFLQVLINLPHPLELIWLVWLILLPGQCAFLLKQNKNPTSQLKRTGELMNFGEIRALGCIGGFILLSFIFAYAASITLKLAGVI